MTEHIKHSGKHVRLRRVILHDKTDSCDSLVSDDVTYLYHRHEAYSGNIFFLTDTLTKKSLVIVSESPVPIELRADYSDFEIVEGDYPVKTAYCDEGEEEHTARELAGEHTLRTPFIMSNTWGDRSKDANVNEAFLREEILCAERLGADIVQIDEGWQDGKWEPVSERFPSGFGALCDFTREHGINMGLWFVPDGEDGYANWNRDAETVLNLYRRFGVKYFKIDGVDLEGLPAEKNFVSFCDKIIKESAGNIVLNMDITNDRRLGYLYRPDFGTLFVENRYTDWGNYYPHNTLRNLWQLSRFIPAGKMQFELLNPTRNRDKYPPDDILAPANYHADYLFACVMVSNPLIWMEMQHLPQDESERLSGIIRVWKQYRDDFREVIPRGSCPDGFSLTGFEIRGERHNYYIGIRENSERDTVAVNVKQILYTDDEMLKCEGNSVIFSEKRKYFWVILN